MSLIPIEHPHRLASPAEAEAWFRALGEKRVSARGFHTTDPARFGHLVAAIEPKHEHTISFESGTLDDAALVALHALALSRFEYLDVRTQNANLRIWPALHSWVHATCSAAVASEALGVPLLMGKNTVGDATVTVNEPHRSHPIDIETKNRETALSMFRALTGSRMDRGFISGVQEDTRPQLVELLCKLRARVNAMLEVEVASARALTEIYEGEQLDWQAGGLLVDFPEGRIHGFLVTPDVSEGHREKWQARVDKALRRAGLVTIV